MAHILKLAYQLRYHRFGSWALDRWAVTLAWGAAALLLGGWLLRGRPALPSWRWGVLALLLLAGAGMLALRVWAARRSYVAFAAELDAVRPTPRLLDPADKVALWATGCFEVEGKAGFFADLQAFWRTFASREHAVMAIQHPARFLLLGATPAERLGMWYIFIPAAQVAQVVSGTVAFGATSGPSLRVDYRVVAAPTRPGKAGRTRQETVYLLFEDAASRDRVWADLLWAHENEYSIEEKNMITPYGAWKSPITPDLLVADTVGLSAPALHGPDIYWCELRPSEKGRVVLVRRTPDGATNDVTPAPFNVRTRVHEYGGVSYLVTDEAIYFANFADQRLYRLQPGTAPQSITPEADLRYADLVLDAARNRLIAVREAHGAGEPVNTLVALDLAQPDGGQVLAAGHDFYASPRLSPDGTRLAWLAWRHPNMPWDGTELWVARIAADGSLADAQVVAGGPAESIFQPEWSPAGELYFVSDRTGWWNLYRLRGGQAESLCPRDAEFGLPQWVFGMRTYGFASERELVCTFYQGGRWHLAVLDVASLALTEIATPYTEISSLQVAGDRVLFLAGSPTEPASLVMLELGTRHLHVLRRASNLALDPGYLSSPQEIEFPGHGGLPVYAYFYPPRNRDHSAPAGEKPPLLVLSHGGPTGAAGATFNLGIQFWTSRGFAVVDVNYGGSAGYGRAFRRRLNGQWGIVDVDDCVAAAQFLAGRGDADPARLAIRGGSAGGYTTLAALTFRDVFKAGASHYGVSDLEALATDTHKFESRYLDNLVGPYPARRDLYIERSPIHHTAGLNCPLILFQGLDDKVVPPEQSRAMYEAARAKGLPVAYLAFEGEGHGFRQAANIVRAAEAELYFYSRVFGFALAEPVAPVKIENL